EDLRAPRGSVDAEELVCPSDGAVRELLHAPRTRELGEREAAEVGRAEARDVQAKLRLRVRPLASGPSRQRPSFHGQKASRTSATPTSPVELPRPNDRFSR